MLIALDAALALPGTALLAVDAAAPSAEYGAAALTANGAETTPDGAGVVWAGTGAAGVETATVGDSALGGVALWGKS